MEDAAKKKREALALAHDARFWLNLRSRLDECGALTAFLVHPRSGSQPTQPRAGTGSAAARLERAARGSKLGARASPGARAGRASSRRRSPCATQRFAFSWWFWPQG